MLFDLPSVNPEPMDDPIVATLKCLQEQRAHFAMLKELTSENQDLKLSIMEMRMAQLRILEDRPGPYQSTPRVIF